MSLVSDALKKAEREAAAREARKAGLPVPLETPMQPYRARRGQRRGGAWIGVLVAVGVALLVAFGFFSTPTPSPGKAADKGATPGTSAPSSPTPALSASRSSGAAAAETPSERPTPPSDREATSAEASRPSPATAPSERPASPSEREATNAEASPTSPQTAPNDRPAPPSESEPRAPSTAKQKEYVRRVDFPDGSKLELGGIAYSETAPFAYMNGRLLKIGEAIAGYTWVAVERDRVVVRGVAGELTLRLKP